MADKEKLFNEFPPVTTPEWEEKIREDLKGADYNKKLVWKPLEGFNVKPYYRSEDLVTLDHLNFYPNEFPYARGNKTDNNSWLIRQDIYVENIEDANKKALDILMKGVDSIGFVFSEKYEGSQEDMNKLLKDISLKAVEINFSGHGSQEMLEQFIEVARQQNVKLDELKGSISFDPIGGLTVKGRFCNDEKTAFDRAKSRVETVADFNGLKAINIHGNNFHNAGATAVQELAFALATGTEYLHRLDEMGIGVDKSAPAMKFTFAVGSNYFMELAKIRAARILWAKIIESFNPCCQKKAKMNIHVVTSQWNKTLYDPYVNMLRTTTEAMSAALAGIDSMTVEPFNVAYEAPTEFSERIARNQQILLKEEAYLDKVVDPAAGSYYIENLTDSIADAAWDLFLTVEEKGGYIAAFKNGFIQEQIAETAQKRDMNIAQRREILLGTNQFPNFGEVKTENVCEHAFKPWDLKREDAIAEPLKMYRGAMAFENLRYNTDKSGKRPKVFMLTIGNLTMRKARAGFACNFFACAGFEVVDNLGFKTVDDGLRAAMDAKADIVVACSSDDEYAEIVPELNEKLDNKAILVVAGYPKALLDDFKAKGITNFIHVKSNVLETLQGFQSQLKIGL